MPPGEAAYPYHAHLTEEELVIVLEGAPSLRTPSGWRDLEQGEVVSFLRGEPGMLAALRQRVQGAFERLPAGGGLRLWFRREDEVDYYDGESPPA